MAWTFAAILNQAASAGEEADAQYLIEAIHELTTDAHIVRLIDAWFAMVDEPDDADRAAYATRFPIPPGAK